MAAIPYENLALHYSPHRNAMSSDVVLDMHKIYSLVVEGGMGRGGNVYKGTACLVLCSGAWALMSRVRLPEPTQRARTSQGALTTKARATMPGEFYSLS